MRRSNKRHWSSRIEEAIRKSGLPKTKIAARAGIEVRSLNRWFEPDPPDPGFSKVAAVCRVLGISLDSLTENQSSGIASGPSRAEILRTLASVLSDAAAAAEIEQLARDDDTDAQHQVGA